ncbi:MAG: TIGR01777 family protein [Ignavibacteria bacterium]|nr:TIGR01777 family protein [Ignavibacteria bacterium]
MFPKKRIILTGATGFIGKNLARVLNDYNYSLVIISRNAEKAKSVISFGEIFINWNDIFKPGSITQLENVESIIHLAGENIFARRWNEKHKKRIYESRIDSTKIIVELISKLKKKPESFICASATGYYGFSSDNEIFTLTSPPGNDFLAKVVTDWEKASAEADSYGIRRVNMRTGIVLDKSGGILRKLTPVFKLYMGAIIGSGRQWLPIISLDDLVKLYLNTLEDKSISGPINAVSKSITMKEFCKNLGKNLNRPVLFRIPEFMLKIVLGEGARYILKGTRTEPL